MVARLAEGIAAPTAQRELDGISARLAEAYPDTNAGKGVIVTPTREMHDPGELVEPRGLEPPPILRVSFVMATGDEVYGSLEPYRDTECGCTVQTRFAGRIVTTGIEGTYTMRHIDDGMTHRGSWSARRVGPPPEAVSDLPEGVRVDEPPAGDPGIVGPTEEEMVAQGGALFRDLGCAFCHGSEAEGGMGPAVDAVAAHRDFSWIYRMILNPDSMLRNDPAASELYAAHRVPMPDRGATPWQALLLYEYLVSRIRSDDPPR